MDHWAVWIGLAGIILLTLTSTLNVALRMPTRARIAEEFSRRGGAGRLEAFIAMRPKYMLTMAILRSVSVGVLFVTVLYAVEAGEATVQLSRTVLACLVAWSFLLVFGVAIPYAWAKYRGDWLIVRLLPFLWLGRLVCLPVMVFVELFDPLVRRLAGAPVRDAKAFADELEQEIFNVVEEGELHGVVDEGEKEMIESVIEMGDTRVEEIMTPRTDVVAMPVGSDLNAVLDTIRSQGHSRIPVYDETIDTILGVLYVKDLLGRDDEKPFQLRAIMRKALFIPESKLVRDLLRDFQKQKVHMAVVLDEYGGTAGLVTIEDILEELVGELADEYEAAAPAEVKRIDDRTYEVDARMRIDDLSDQLHITLPDNQDYETIGGFVFSTLGKIPKVGERCEHANVGIQVLAAEPRRITRLLLHINSPAETKELEG